MDHGFFHPSRGYWETTSEPSADIVASYPAGTVQIPLKPGDGYEWSGAQWVPPVITGPTPEQREAAAGALIQSHLDAQARSMGYESIATAVTYADEPAVPRFQTEGQALRAWRSLVWATGYQLLADVKAGTRPEPTDAELLALLPAFVPPTIPTTPE